MGREGVAYTFVLPDEGEELTRIEMRIDTLLKQDKMPGMDLVAKVETLPEALDPEEVRELEEKRAAQARLGRGRVGRHRRGL